ncbi:MAG: transglutaminase-like domain-containing protein [Candidatus Dormibacteria bacterium]
MGEEEYWATSARITAPGVAASAIAALPADPAALRAVSQRLVIHYAEQERWGEWGVGVERLPEVDTRYAAASFDRLRAMGPADLAAERPPAQRMVGCCRDFTVLYLTMARDKGVPARGRVGYASYFRPGWWVDHEMVELWDPGQRRWRLVEPEIVDDYVPPDGEGAFDPLDVPRERFLTGAEAWARARAGQLDPERCLVVPELEEPYTRSWSSLRHHVVQDLAALRKQEMLLWDQWGILNGDLPISGRELELLDELAAALRDQPRVSEIASWSRHPGIGVPGKVTSYSPTQVDPLEVDVRDIAEEPIAV